MKEQGTDWRRGQKVFGQTGKESRGSGTHRAVWGSFSVPQRTLEVSLALKRVLQSWAQAPMGASYDPRIVRDSVAASAVTMKRLATTGETAPSDSLAWGVWAGAELERRSGSLTRPATVFNTSLRAPGPALHVRGDDGAGNGVGDWAGHRM